MARAIDPKKCRRFSKLGEVPAFLNTFRNTSCTSVVGPG